MVLDLDYLHHYHRLNPSDLVHLNSGLRTKTAINQATKSQRH